MKPPPEISTAARLRFARAIPSSILGIQTFSIYFRVQKLWRRTPSATRPAIRSMSGPTAARLIGGKENPVFGGENSGVIKVN